MLQGAHNLGRVADAGALPEMMPLLRRLWPICRSLTGPGVRETLDVLGETVPVERHDVASGTQVFDWTVPPEWSIRDAYVLGPDGTRVVDFRRSNLHVVGYSEPVDAVLSLEQLQERLHSLPEMPDAVPYLTSYYRPTWGFCISQRDRDALAPGEYRCVIDSTLDSGGRLDYGQVHLPGASPDEVLLSTYVCHPSMANNELSGPVTQMALLSILAAAPGRRLSYRGAFTTETLGTLCFIQRFGPELVEHTVAGYVVSCVGDDGPFTYVRSRQGAAAADRVFEHVLRHCVTERPVGVRDFHPVGSDERQYCSPGLNLPVGSFSRSRFEDFPEYHTSRDDLTFVSEEGLARSLHVLVRACQALEMNVHPLRTEPVGEPQLGKRGLYSSDRTSVSDATEIMLFVLAFADGTCSLLDIAERAGRPVWSLLGPVQDLVDAGVVTLSEAGEGSASRDA